MTFIRAQLFLVFDTLYNTVLVLFELALLIGALVLMMIHVAFQNDSVSAISPVAKATSIITPGAPIAP